MDPRVLYVHPYNHLDPKVIPVGAIGAINLLPARAVGRYAHEVSRQDIERARVVVIDVHWTFPLPTLDAVVARVRRVSHDAKVVVGGLTASFYRDVLCARLDCDYIVFGHAEVSLVRLVEALLSGDEPPPLPNVCSRGDALGEPTPTTQEAFDGLDWITIDWFPTFARVVRELHAQSHLGASVGRWGDAYPLLPLIRGCPRECGFCYGAYQRRVFGGQMLRRSPANLLGDISRIESAPDLRFLSLYVGDASALRPYAEAVEGRRFDLGLTVFCCGAPEVELVEVFVEAFRGEVLWSVIQPSDVAPLPGDPGSEERSRRLALLLGHVGRRDRCRAIVWHVTDPEPCAVEARRSDRRLLTASGVDWSVTRPDLASITAARSSSDHLRDVVGCARKTASANLLAGLVPSLSCIPVKAFGDDDVFNPLNEGRCDEFEARLVRLSIRNLRELGFYGFDGLGLGWGARAAVGTAARWSRCGDAIDGSAEWRFDHGGFAWRGRAELSNDEPVELTLIPTVLSDGSGPIALSEWPRALVPAVPVQPGPKRSVTAGGRLLEGDVEVWVRDRGRRRRWRLSRAAATTLPRDDAATAPKWTLVVLLAMERCASAMGVEVVPTGWSRERLCFSLRSSGLRAGVVVTLRDTGPTRLGAELEGDGAERLRRLVEEGLDLAEIVLERLGRHDRPS